MPTLDWLGKKAVVDHHHQVPFHLLRENAERSVGDPAAGSLLVQGDNLLALKALLPYYAGQVKCIYIDPPYNTGSERWIYNDNVSAPEIRRWLGEVVGREAEDLSRHDKWLCMMYPRLMLLKEFLRDDGAIFVSIDDVEVGHLRLLMDEVFGPRNFIANIVWQSKDTPGNNSSGVAETHNHIVAYKRSDNFSPNLLVRSEKQIGTYTNPDNDPRGPWLGTPLTRAEHRDRDYYAILNDNGREVFPPAGSSWRRPPAKMRELADERRIWWGKSGDAEFPMEKKFLAEVKEGVVNQTWWPYQFAGSTRNASAELKKIFDGRKVFDTPKPIQLVKVITAMAADPDSIILDSFAGSGTTGHAVMQLNAEDGGNRRFILCEMKSAIAKDIVAERLRRVIAGYSDTPGLGGGFRYCELGPSLFGADGRIRDEVSFEELARHVFFTETGQPLPEDALNGTPLLGVANGTAVYLLYNGILRDRSPGGGNALTREVLASLPPHDGPKVVYGTSRRVGPETLRRAGITFRQTPYEIRTR